MHNKADEMTGRMKIQGQSLGYKQLFVSMVSRAGSATPSLFPAGVLVTNSPEDPLSSATMALGVQLAAHHPGGCWAAGLQSCKSMEGSLKSPEKLPSSRSPTEKPLASPREERSARKVFWTRKEPSQRCFHACSFKRWLNMESLGSSPNTCLLYPVPACFWIFYINDTVNHINSGYSGWIHILG